MNRWLFIMLATLLSGTPAAHGGMTGREVYAKVHEVRIRSLDRQTEATMTLLDKGGGTRSRSLVEYSKAAGSDAYQVLVVFKTPADLKDVGFLIHARTFSDRDLWAYFPELKRIRRIPTSSQDDSFFGSDFSYDDFGGPPNLDDYSFTILRDEVLDGTPCHVIEVTPKVRRKWSRYVAWVAKGQWIHRKIEYYRDKELYRAGTFSDVRIVDDIPTPFTMKMENIPTGHKTDLVINSIRYHTSFPDELFTQRALERAGK
ncbi:MAG: outer membrane lipoprotein-sorting protein [Deltaproteobacteria bacterium]|nr:outer membrane lipoprotein-sorting protein [Deltaproteobacteria bacterium]